MHASSRGFLEGLVDYAGLFPPAALTMDLAVNTFAADRLSEQGWMLSRFICPAGRLEEFQAAAEGIIHREDPWKLSLLPGPPSEEEPVAGFTEVMTRIAQWIETVDGGVLADVLEVPIPTWAKDPRELCSALRQVARDTLPAFETIYFEAAAGPGWDQRAAALIESLSGLEDVGFKQRCGGVKADAYPSVERVAAAVEACHQAGVPYKGTAGLHHPVRHYREDLSVHEHGFLNLFGAGVLLDACGIDRLRLREILADDNAGNFVFDKDGFHHRELTASAEQIARARQFAVISYGSCSFDEPREDLRSLRIL